MRITIEPTHEGVTQTPYQQKVILESAGDDQGIEEVLELLKAALLAYGYAPDTVNKALGE